MDKADVLHLFDYMYWVDRRLLDAAARLDGLDAGSFMQPTTVTTRDLRGTLVHELDVEWSWRLALQGVPSEQFDELQELRPEDYPDVPALAHHWRRDEAEMRSWLASLSEEDVAAEVTPVLSGRARPMWQYLLHIVFHAAQQQADAATLLTIAGQSPGDIGYLEWVFAP